VPLATFPREAVDLWRKYGERERKGLAAPVVTIFGDDSEWKEAWENGRLVISAMVAEGDEMTEIQYGS